MKNLLECILFFPSVTRFRILLLLVLTVSATCFEGFGVAMLYPVMDFIEKGRDFEVLAASSRMWTYIGKVFDFAGIPKDLLSLMGVVFGLLMARQIFIYLKGIYSAWITEGLFSDIRSEGFRRFVKADMSFYDSHGIGQLINVLTVDGARAGVGMFTFFNLLSASMVFTLYFVFLLLLSWGMTAFAMGIMGCVGIVLKSRIAKSERIGRDVSKYNDEMSSSIVERLNGIRLVKLSAAEEREAGFVKGISGKIRVNTYALSRIKARMEFMVDPMVILAGLTILYLSVEIFHMTLARTGIFVFVLLRLMPYTKDIFNSRQALAGLSGSLFRVNSLIEEAREAHRIKGGGVSTLQLQDGIRFEDVFFSYGGEQGYTLKNVNLWIPAGRMTALVGRSGAGKSTLADLIPRLRVPEKGRILFDDCPIEEVDLGVLRRSIAFVSQEGFLFNDTIWNNIRYGCREGAKEEDVLESARMAYADHFVKALPEGFQTVVGEKGMKLSGGQRQRIILARALFQKASVIILDEPTSSLDSESELYIQRALEEIRSASRLTLIIIAHRLSTIRSADQIVVLDEGRVVECGNHHALMHEETWYADMVRMQAGA